MTSNDRHRVAAILAQFPGPVRLTPSRTKLLWILAGLVALGALTASTAIRSPAWSSGALVGWAATVILSVYASAAILCLVPGAAHLTLGAHGFEVKVLRRFYLSWKAVGDFTVERSVLLRYVAFRLHEDASAPHRTTEPRYGRLFDSFGLPYDDFVRLMNQWRATALRETPEPD